MPLCIAPASEWLTALLPAECGNPPASAPVECENRSGVPVCGRAREGRLHSLVSTGIPSGNAIAGGVGEENTRRKGDWLPIAEPL